MNQVELKQRAVLVKDHTKAAHDALNIDAATLGGHAPGYFVIDSLHGTATITAENSYVDVVHNLGSTPTSYAITPLSAEGAIWFLSDEGINSFRINLLSSQFADASFKWRIFK